MAVTVSFKLAPEGDKSFLERVAFERQTDGTVDVGIIKPNGDWYAWANISWEQLQNTLKILEMDT